MNKIIGFITKLFPVWVVIFAFFAFSVPEPFAKMGPLVPYFLAIVMLSMGLTMSINDFKLVLSQPKDVLYGTGLRYIIMPGIAWCIAVSFTHFFGMSHDLAAGIILVGCCPSGTASNVMTFISKGDTALSITVSSVNTLLAPIATPLLFAFLAGEYIDIKASALLVDILIIMVIPIVAGLILKIVFPKFVDKIIPVVPLISVIALLGIITAVVALSADKLAQVALIAFVAVALHNMLGLGLGYSIPRAIGFTHKKSKAIAFEIGMENSGLAVALAMAHLNPIVAIPGAIFSAWHNFSGAILATYWGNKDKNKETETEVTDSNLPGKEPDS